MPKQDYTILTPPPSRILAIGGAAVAATLFWLSAFATISVSASRDMPREIYNGLLAAAITTTLVAVMLGVAYAAQSASARNHTVLLSAVAAVAAEQEQIGAKVDKIDHWDIYTKVMSDVLGENPKG